MSFYDDSKVPKLDTDRTWHLHCMLESFDRCSGRDVELSSHATARPQSHRTSGSSDLQTSGHRHVRLCKAVFAACTRDMACDSTRDTCSYFSRAHGISEEVIWCLTTADDESPDCRHGYWTTRAVAAACRRGISFHHVRPKHHVSVHSDPGFQTSEVPHVGMVAT